MKNSLKTIVLILFYSIQNLVVAQQPITQNFIDPELYIEQGIENYAKGNFGKAIQDWKYALENIDKNKQVYKAAEVFLSIAHAYQMVGLYQQGLNELNDAWIYIEKIQSSSLHTKWLHQLGNLYLASGEKDIAIEKLKQAVAIARESSNILLLANILNSFANALWVAKFEIDAIAFYRESLQLSLGIHAYDIAAKTQVNLIKAHIERNDISGIANEFNEAIKILHYLPENYTKANLLTQLAYFSIKSHKKKSNNSQLLQSKEWLDDAKIIVNKLQNIRLLSFILGYQGQLYEIQNQWLEAKSLTQKALFFSKQANAADISYLWQWQLARLAKNTGNIQEAIAMHRKAIKTLEPVRVELSNGYRRSDDFFQINIKPVYLDFVDLLLKKAAAEKNYKQKKSLLLEARNITEAQKTAELEDYFRDECVVALKNDTVPLEKIDNEIAILYPIILPDRLEILISLPNYIDFKTVSIDANFLNSTANEFRDLIQNDKSYAYSAYAKRLYQWLIDPVKPILNKNDISTLVIVPDGALRNIPFAALKNNKSFLIEQYALATTPSLTLTKPKKITQGKPRVLIAGISDNVQGFAALPHVSEELQAVQSSIGGKILQDKKYTIETLTKELQRSAYSIIHMATHGVFSDSAEDSFLLTYNSKINMSELENLLQISQFREESVDLLTLSACETARGNDRAALGLAGVAIKASARSALASLWLVNDQATSELMNNFYYQMNSNSYTSKAKVLQSVQKAFIIRGQHPAYWSPFLLIGSWL